MDFKNYDYNNINNNYGIKSEVFNNINKYNLKNQNKINKKSEKKMILIKIQKNKV